MGSKKDGLKPPSPGQRKTRAEREADIQKNLNRPFTQEQDDLEDLDKPMAGTKKTQIPKTPINFTDEWIEKNIKDKGIKQLLIEKREADKRGDSALSRKLRRTLRSRNFYVSQNRDEV